MEQKRYTLLPKQTVDNWVEAIGINKIPDEVSEILSEDITYHIRELVHKSIQIMKHSRRSYLSVDDINSALRESDTDPIFGHSGIEPFNFKAFHTKEGAKVCYLDEKDVNLRETAFDSSLPNEAGETSVKANWLVLEGFNCNSRGQLQKDLEPPLNEVMSKYLQNVTRALISEGDQLRKVALDDLCSNKKLQIIPHLISFCSTQIKQHTGKETFPSIATHIISTINALVKNHSVILTPYLIQLAKILLFTLMEAKIEAQHWYLHQKAATVLSLLAMRHPHSSPDIREQLLKSYLDTFTDPTSKQMAQLHGALCGITQLGITAITNGLFPKIFEKMEILQKHLTPIDDLQGSPELLHVTNQLNETLSILFQARCFPYVKQLHKKTSSKMSKLYTELNELFGESFVLKCNLNAPKNPEPPVNDNLYNSLVTPLPPKKQPSLANDQDNTNGKFSRYEALKKILISRDYNIKNTHVGNITVKTKWRKTNLSKTNILDRSNFISDKRNNQSLTKTTRGIHKSYGRKKSNISQKIYLTML